MQRGTQVPYPDHRPKTMISRRHALALAAAGSLSAALPAFAEDTPAVAKPVDVDALLFDARHFDRTPQTTKISYQYRRISQKPELTHPSFTDTIELMLEPGDKPENRNIVVTLFKGENHRPAGPFDGISFNPVVILTLEYHLNELAKILRANPRYLKNAIRLAMREKSTAEKVKLTVSGKTIDATKITFKPFVDDRTNPQRLGVFLKSVYEFTVSDELPGMIYQIHIVTPDPATPGTNFLEEDMRYVDP